MPALPLQLRLEPHHLAALDAVTTVRDPASGLNVTISRQQVILGVIDAWILSRATPPPPPEDVPVPTAKAALAARTVALRQTMSHSKIAALYTSEGLPTPGGTGKRWTNSMIERLVKAGLQEG